MFVFSDKSFSRALFFPKIIFDVLVLMHNKVRVKDSSYEGDPSLNGERTENMLQINKRASRDRTMCTCTCGRVRVCGYTHVVNACTAIVCWLHQALSSGLVD